MNTARTGTERSRKSREARPHSMSADKSRQRQAENLIRFHVRREFLHNIPIPDSVDQGSGMFVRVKAAYLNQVNTPVEVEVSDG